MITKAAIEKLALLKTKEEIYQYIMSLGTTLPPFAKEWMIEENLVSGCQSIMYLKATFHEGFLTFNAHSDALISKGLAALLLTKYNNKAPEYILKNKPTFLEELKILEVLTPSRANGVLSLYHKMQKEALEGICKRVNNVKLT